MKMELWVRQLKSMRSAGLPDRLRRPARLSLLLLLSAFLLATGLGSSEIIEFCGDIPVAYTDWSDSITLPKFDSSLGEMTGARLTVNFTVLHELDLRNGKDHGANVSIIAGGNLSLALPDQTAATITAVNESVLNINPRESVSFNQSCNNSQSFDLGPLESLKGSSSADTVLLPMAATSYSSLQSGGIETSVSPSAGVRACIIYEFTPAGNAEVDRGVASPSPA